MWESDHFIQCGVRVGHQKVGGFLLSQNEFVGELQEIPIPSHRRKEKDNPWSQKEQTGEVDSACNVNRQHRNTPLNKLEETLVAEKSDPSEVVYAEVTFADGTAY